jgi:hypothetical protein
MYGVPAAAKVPPMPSTTLSRRLATALVAASAALCLTASPAAADSVAYVKDGNVWLTTTDGSRQYQVTTDGGYSTVSQADSGRMVALHGDKIRHLEQDGTLIAEIATPVTTSTDPSMQFRGPFEPEISPNGQRVSYTYYWEYTGQDPYCMPPSCYTKRTYHGTGFTDPNRLTSWDEPGFLRRSGWIAAHWVDDDQVLLSNPSMPLNEDTILWSPSDSDSLRRWYFDPLYEGNVEETVISRDKSAMVTVTNGGKKIGFMRSEGLFYPNYPHRCFEAGLTGDGKISSPTLSADGTQAFFASPDGVHAAGLPKFPADHCPDATDPGKLLVPGGSNPSWGPADVPAPRQAPKPQPQPQPLPGPKPGENPTPVGPAQEQPATVTAKLKVSGAKLRTALRRGFTVKLTGAKRGRHTVVAKVAGKRVAAGTAVVAANGTGSVTLKFTAAAKRKLARKSSVKLTISGAGARATLTLKR